jgi:hypothetical protein
MLIVLLLPLDARDPIHLLLLLTLWLTTSLYRWFATLADPIRRAIFARFANGACSVNKRDEPGDVGAAV